MYRIRTDTSRLCRMLFSTTTLIPVQYFRTVLRDRAAIDPSNRILVQTVPLALLADGKGIVAQKRATGKSTMGKCGLRVCTSVYRKLGLDDYSSSVLTCP